MSFVSGSLMVVVGMALVVSTTGCDVIISLNEDGTAGLAEIGVFASAETARDIVRAACGIGDDNPYNPLASGPYLPAITRSVHPFVCIESEKDMQ